MSLSIGFPAALPALAGLDAVLGLLRDLPADVAFAATLGAMIAVVAPLGGHPGLSLWDRVIPYPADPGTPARDAANGRRPHLSPGSPEDPMDERSHHPDFASTDTRSTPPTISDQRPEAA